MDGPEFLILILAAIIGGLFYVQIRASRQGNKILALGMYLLIAVVILVGGFVLLVVLADALDERERRERFGDFVYDLPSPSLTSAAASADAASVGSGEDSDLS